MSKLLLPLCLCLLYGCGSSFESSTWQKFEQNGFYGLDNASSQIAAVFDDISAATADRIEVVYEGYDLVLNGKGEVIESPANFKRAEFIPDRYQLRKAITRIYKKHGAATAEVANNNLQQELKVLFSINNTVPELWDMYQDAFSICLHNPLEKLKRMIFNDAFNEYADKDLNQYGNPLCIADAEILLAFSRIKTEESAQHLLAMYQSRFVPFEESERKLNLICAMVNVGAPMYDKLVVLDESDETLDTVMRLIQEGKTCD